MSIVPDSVVKNKVYELLELENRGHDILEIGINLIRQIIGIKDLTESVKLLRLMSYTIDRANLLLKTALMTLEYDSRNELIKWSLAHGADPNTARTKTRFSNFFGEESCFNYYVNMHFLGSTKIDTVKLMIDSGADVNSKVLVPTGPGMISDMNPLKFTLENIDFAELEYTCMVAILVEANF